MTKRVNYEDNLFFLNMVLKQIAAALKLNIDASLFKDHLIEEIRFLDTATRDILGSLRGNALMIDRYQHFRDLDKLNRSFTALLEELLAGEQPLAEALKDNRSLLEQLLEARRQERSEIREQMAGFGGSGGEAAQIVSEEEYRILLEEDSAEP